MGPSRDDVLLIRRDRNRFTAKGRTIEPDSVAHLLPAISAEPIPIITYASLGIDREWLVENADAALRKAYTPPTGTATHGQRALFERLFADEELVAKVVHRALGGGGTDDYPELEVAIRWSDGRTTIVRSESSALFMIPFRIETGGEGSFTCDSRVSRAIAALLPEEFANRERLAGEALPERLGRAILHEREREWGLLELEEHFGADLAGLRGRFEIETSRVARISSFDVGNPDYSTYLSWNATLRDGRLPPNVAIGVSIPIEEKRLASLEPFLQRIDALEDRVLAVPWLAEDIAAHPDTTIEIRFVTNRALGTNAAEHILEVLKKTGRTSLAERLTPLLGDSILLVASEGSNWSRWILLPDGTTMLWHYKGHVPLGRTEASVAPWDCNSFWCSARIFGPDGLPVENAP
jgi:hypothetical protein